VLTNVQPPSPQNYSVVVSNAEGSVISTNLSGTALINDPGSPAAQQKFYRAVAR
jgi:hypothetical protein